MGCGNSSNQPPPPPPEVCKLKSLDRSHQQLSPNWCNRPTSRRRRVSSLIGAKAVEPGVDGSPKAHEVQSYLSTQDIRRCSDTPRLSKTLSMGCMWYSTISQGCEHLSYVNCAPHFLALHSIVTFDRFDRRCWFSSKYTLGKNSCYYCFETCASLYLLDAKHQIRSPQRLFIDCIYVRRYNI